jgi:ABC-2 type transport system ATP-binding protein
MTPREFNVRGVIGIPQTWDVALNFPRLFSVIMPSGSGEWMRLTIDNVSKTYRSGVRALHNFSLELGSGVLGLLGPNGAGKSTLMSILATITQPSAGRVVWEDGSSSFDIVQHPNALRQVLGYLPQEFGFYPKLTALEFLEYLAAVKGIPSAAAKRRIQELLQLVNLVDACKRPLGGFSGGMRQRVGIAQALLNDPKLLIVDEPTAGLDPEERVRFRNLISELAADRIVILSTHIVSDVESTANLIALLNKGELLRHVSPEDLLAAVEGRVWECVVSSADFPLFKQHHRVSGVVRRADGFHVRVVSEDRPWGNAVLQTAQLEDAYLYCLSARGEVYA